jgi:diguanylate cyclase (GGDEF)-like protein/PAS domain S-box-containing protein
MARAAHDPKTQRELSDDAVTGSEFFSQRMLDTTPNLIYIYDLVEDRNVYTNREVTEFLGYSSDEVLAFGSALFDHILHPDDAILVAEHHARMRALPAGDDRVLEVDYRMRRADGQWRWLHSRDVPFARDASGVVTRILGSTDDVTEQKDAAERLRESEARYRGIVDSMLDGYFRSDADHLLVDVSPGLAEMCGFDSVPEMLGLHAAILNEDEDDRAHVMDQLLREGVVLDHVGRGRRKDGSTFWASLSIMAALDANGGLIGTQGFIRDVTARRHAEAELEEAKASAEEANRKLQQALLDEQRLARADVLTDVNNRRYWFELAEHEFEVATRYLRPLAVVLFDIDGFKLVNDRFGHAAGDKMLECVSQVARGELRAADVIGRHGGDEFVIALPMTTAEQAFPIAERILAGVGASSIETVRGKVAVTLSIGIAETLFAQPEEHLDGDGSVEAVVNRADEAMYEAKTAGGDRIRVCPEPVGRPGPET